MTPESILLELAKDEMT